MNNKLIRFTTELIISWYNHWCLYPIFLVLAYVINSVNNVDKISTYDFIIISIFPIIAFLIRQKQMKLYKLVLMHIISIGIILLLFSSNIYRGIGLVWMIVYFIISIKLIIGEVNDMDNQLPPGVPAVIYLLGCVFLIKMEQSTLAANLYIPLLLVGLLYLVSQYFNNYINFLTVNKSGAASLNEEQMFKSGALQAAVFSFFAIVIVGAISGVKKLSEVVRYIGELIIRFNRWFFSHFHHETTLVDPEFAVNGPSGGGDFAMPPGEEEPFIIWQILQYLAYVAVAVLAVYVLYRAIKYLAKLLKSSFFTISRDVDDLSELGLSDKRYSLESDKTSNRISFKNIFNPSNKTKARKLYKKYVLSKLKDKDNLNNLTSSEIDSCIKIEHADQIELSNAYDYIRYSENEITDKEYKAFKATIN